MSYKYDDLYFDTLSPVQCYWAGFIAADGCICERDRALILVSKAADADHLKRFADEICFTGPVRINKGGGYKKNQLYARLAIYGCTGIISDLGALYNIFPRKTESLIPPIIKDTRLRLAFFAGFIDGDGSVFMTPKGLNISIGGTKNMMMWCKRLVDEIAPPARESNIRKIKHAWFHEYKIRSSRANIIEKAIRALNLPLLKRKWSYV